MHSADYAVARCPSVRHTPVLCLNHYTYPQVFSPSGSSTILVFPYQKDGTIPTGTPPPNGSVECKGVWKNHDFRPVSRFILQTMQDRAIVTMEGE